MRWLETQRRSGRRENARRRRAARHWQRLRRRPRLGQQRPESLVVGFHQRGQPIVGRPARLGSDAVKGVCQRRAQIAGDQAMRLGAQELRPAGPIRRGAGPRPAPRNTLAIVVAETLTPSPFSSPWMRM
jgi:hypothetical protein